MRIGAETTETHIRYIDKIDDRLDVTIDYLIRGHEIKSDSLISQEMELMYNYKKINGRRPEDIFGECKIIIGRKLKKIVRITNRKISKIRRDGSGNDENRRKNRTLR